MCSLYSKAFSMIPSAQGRQAATRLGVNLSWPAVRNGSFRSLEEKEDKLSRQTRPVCIWIQSGVEMVFEAAAEPILAYSISGMLSFELYHVT